MNGSVGTVIEIFYDHPMGPTSPMSLPPEVVVDFHESILDYSLIPGSPSTYISILVTTDRCDFCCCSMTTIPLRIYKAITIYKSQGITVGPGKVWENVMV